nr:hypothetical protein [Phycisphaerales bacterium]
HDAPAHAGEASAPVGGAHASSGGEVVARPSRPSGGAGLGGYPVAAPRGPRQCMHTGAPLTPSQVIVAVISQDPHTGQLARMDYSLDGWAAARAAGTTSDDRILGFWKTHVSTPGAKAKPLLDDEALLDLFNQSDAPSDAGSDGPSPRANLRLVLALLMIRRRLLSHEGNKGSTMLVRPRGVPRPPEGPPLLEVIDPGLSEAAIAETLAELESLGMGEQADAAPQPAPATSEGRVS